MNREELEKEIKEIANYLGCNDDELVSEIMKLIPEVLKSVIGKEKTSDSIYGKMYNMSIKGRKERIKELYNIDL